MLYWFDNVPKRLATFAFATIARDAERLDRASIVNRQLFARTDAAPAIEKKAPLPASGRQIRIATAVDELGATAANGSINHAATIGDDSIVSVGTPKLAGLIQAQAPASKFDHLLARRNILEREYSRFVNPRPANSQGIAH
jgi:hypothetical protein